MMLDEYKEGLKAYRAGDYETASQLFHSVTEADEDNAKAWNAYGLTLSKLNNFDNADTCYENALMIDPGYETYQKNRDINENKHSRKTKKPLKPASATTKVKTGRPLWQTLGITFVATFFLMILAAAMGGNNDEKTAKKPTTIPVINQQTQMPYTTSEDRAFATLASSNMNELQPRMLEITNAASKSDIPTLKRLSKETGDLVWEMIPKVNEIKVSLKFEHLKSTYLMALNDLCYGYSSVYAACVAYDKGDMIENQRLLKEAISGINDANAGFKKSGEEATALTNQ